MTELDLGGLPESKHCYEERLFLSLLEQDIGPFSNYTPFLFDARSFAIT